MVGRMWVSARSVAPAAHARGQLVIESKEDAGKRGTKSPHRAVGIMLAFAGREPAIMKTTSRRLVAPKRPRTVALAKRAAGG